MYPILVWYIKKSATDGGGGVIVGVTATIAIELYTDSVFSVGIRLVFLGILPTDTEGKLGWYISVLKKWREPPFP